MGMEIERKWLPDPAWVKIVTEGVKPAEIVQGYLCRNPVIRIRKEDDMYYLTYKGSGLKAHEEYNLPINKEAFEELLPKCSGRVIRKKRYKIPFNPIGPGLECENQPVKDCSDSSGRTAGESEHLIAEIDVFETPEKGLTLLEVEFPDIVSADAFQAPAVFGRDVTRDPAYYNAALSR